MSVEEAVRDPYKKNQTSKNTKNIYELMETYVTFKNLKLEVLNLLQC